MEQYIKKLLFKLRIELALFLVLVMAVAALGVLNVIPNGVFATREYAQTTYIINIVVIACAFLMVFAALKLFRLNTEQSLKRYTLDDAANVYHKWSFVRLALLFIVIVGALTAYFITYDDTGLFCAAIVMLITLIYCVPSFPKIQQYLENSQNQ